MATEGRYKDRSSREVYLPQRVLHCEPVLRPERALASRLDQLERFFSCRQKKRFKKSIRLGPARAFRPLPGARRSTRLEGGNAPALGRTKSTYRTRSRAGIASRSPPLANFSRQPRLVDRTPRRPGPVPGCSNLDRVGSDCWARGGPNRVRRGGSVMKEVANRSERERC